MMVLDGVLHRHPGLRGASVELGAGWVPELLRRLDWVVEHWSRNDDALKALARKPSEQLTEQMAFTPFGVRGGRLVHRAVQPRPVLFSSDYPTSRAAATDRRFERALGDASPAVRDAFYEGNFRRIFPNLGR